MKAFFIVSFLIIFHIFPAQNKGSAEFTFNVKKWNKAYKTQNKQSNAASTKITLSAVQGRATSYIIVEHQMTMEKLANITFFKGKSEDGRKIISLTILPKTLNGSYLENGRQYFIEPVKNKCNTYKVYPSEVRNPDIGQEADVLK